MLKEAPRPSREDIDLRVARPERGFVNTYTASQWLEWAMVRITVGEWLKRCQAQAL